LTKSAQAPELVYRDATGVERAVRFDGVDGNVLIDRKVAVTTFPKSQAQALRQSEALAKNGLRGRWEVPDEIQAARAERMFEKLGIENIDVRVVPQ
jgi:filamentous hemagglutinin